MRSIALFLIILASALLILWYHSVDIAMDPHPANPFYPPSRLERLSQPVSLAVAFGLQFAFAWYSRPRSKPDEPAMQTSLSSKQAESWGNFWFRLLVAFCSTALLTPCLFYVLLLFSGV